MADPVPESCSCSALRQAARHVTRFYDEALAPVDLGLNQYAILSKLNRHGPNTLQALADQLVMDRSTLGHLLRALERRQLVTIGVSDADRRQRIIALTAIGKALFDEAKPLWIKAEAHFERVFGAADARGLRAILKQVVATPLADQPGHPHPPSRDEWGHELPARG